MPYWHFNQNNSGGRFVINDADGIGPHVWIEAPSRDNAVLESKRLGIYFDGCATGDDCPCCGDRWHEPWEDEGVEKPEFDEYSFNWHDTVYVHRLDRTIERIKGSKS